MAERYICVGVVSGNLEADFIQTYLQSYGIPCVLSGEALGRVYGLDVGPLAEIEIMVPAQYEETAREVMKAYQKATAEE